MMLTNQSNCLLELESLAKSDKHSILIEGPAGSGKTYLSKRYADLLGIEDYQIIQPKVSEVKDAINNCYQINNRIVICIENLDTGVNAAAYSALKFLEEPASHVYIVITCRNLNYVPDTIISRSAVVTLSPPTFGDLCEYGKHKDLSQYNFLESKPIWQCVKTYSDIESLFDMPIDHISYILKILETIKPTDSVSNIIWAIQKYPDGSASDVELIIRYIMCSTNSRGVWKICNDCLKELSDNRIASHAIVARFAFDFKYAI